MAVRRLHLHDACVQLCLSIGVGLFLCLDVSFYLSQIDP